MSPGKIDRGSVRRHLQALDEALSQLNRHAGQPLEVLQNNNDKRWAIERGLQLCVQNVLDLATHLAASAGRNVTDYRSAIEHLGKLNIISPELAGRLLPLAGFRNALVHGYIDIDVSIVHNVLNQHLDQLRQFASRVEHHVESADID